MGGFVFPKILVGKNLVKKTIPETKKIIDEQISKLQEIQKELEKNLEEIGMEFQKTLIEAQECEEEEEKHRNKN